jgi:16S rRNA (adenine1518-N6/adenine1519-N6)-dimethyltransferase
MAAPRKRFGQHFLTDPRILARIADALAIEPGDSVVEIGPGRGALTEPLLQRVGPGGHLTAIEVDRDLAAALRAHYAEHAGFAIVEGDVLKVPLAPAGAAGGRFLLVGNIPYNITTPILFRALEAPRAVRMVFMIQREVAERLAAAPGTEEYGALSANAQALATIEILFRVPAGAFTPPPKVDSAVIRVTPRADPVVSPDEEAAFRVMVQGLFSFRRKQMIRAVRNVCRVSAERSAEMLAAAGIEPTDRPEVLAPADFARLLRASRA